MTLKTITISQAVLSSAADMIRDHIEEAPRDEMHDELNQLADALGAAAMTWERLAIVTRN